LSAANNGLKMMSKTEDLEVKIAFLEETVTALNKEFFTQQKELEEVKKQMALLLEKMRTVQSDHQEPLAVDDEKPPHY